MCVKNSCREGSFFNETSAVCVEKVCTCNNGVHAVGSKCNEHGNEQCLVCSRGYSFELKLNDKIVDVDENKVLNFGNYPNLQKTCIKTECQCQHGTPATGLACTRHNLELCHSCDDGFHLQCFNL